MKILACDIGDVWTGTAISDPLGMFARPYQTIETKNLSSFLSDLFNKEDIKTIIIGHPQTLRATSSEQTKKVEKVKVELEKEFTSKTFLFWDERLSSKKAEALHKAKTKEDKLKSHSVAAAFILEGYLAFAHPIQD